MITGDTKRIIVIKNIASNFIEEAILILKCEPDAANISGPVSDGHIAGSSKDEHNSGSSGASYKKVNINNEFILKEAEMIISSYVRENRLQLMPERQKKANPGILASKTTVNVLINSLLLGSMALLLFIIVRML